MVPARDAGSRFFRVSEGGTILKIDFQGVFLSASSQYFTGDLPGIWIASESLTLALWTFMRLGEDFDEVRTLRNGLESNHNHPTPMD